MGEDGVAIVARVAAAVLDIEDEEEEEEEEDCARPYREMVRLSTRPLARMTATRSSA